MTSPQLPPFLDRPIYTVQIHAQQRHRINRDNLTLFAFFTAFFAVIIAHAR